MNLKQFIATLLAAGVSTAEARRIEARKSVGIRLDYIPSKINAGPFKGWPGNAKAKGKAKRRAKLHVRKMKAIKERKANRVRFKAIILNLLSLKNKIKKASNKTIKVGYK